MREVFSGYDSAEMIYLREREMLAETQLLPKTQKAGLSQLLRTICAANFSATETGLSIQKRSAPHAQNAGFSLARSRPLPHAADAHARVMQIARTIARALRLNEDLCEAIALGHDLGHTPFGHAGERVLQRCFDPDYTHYKQSLRAVDFLERQSHARGARRHTLPYDRRRRDT